MDLEDMHQEIYKAVHERLRPFLDDEKLANAVWLGTEDAAKEVIKRLRRSDQEPRSLK